MLAMCLLHETCLGGVSWHLDSIACLSPRATCCTVAKIGQSNLIADLGVCADLLVVLAAGGQFEGY